MESVYPASEPEVGVAMVRWDHPRYLGTVGLYQIKRILHPETQ